MAVIATDEFKATINAALERTGGNVKQAAVLLDSPDSPMPVQRLREFIRNNADLDARWGSSKQKAPSGAVTIHRPANPVPTPPTKEDSDSQDDADIALALAKEDASMREGLESMGIRGDSLKLAAALQQFHSKHYKRAIELIGGGVTKQYLDTLAEIEKINEELSDENDDLKPEREFMLRLDRRELIEATGRMFDRANRAAMTQAIIKHKLESNKGRGTGKRPGFLAVQAQSGSTVHVHTEADEAGSGS